MERYSNVSKKDYLPNEQEIDLEGTPEKKRIFFALLLTLAMTQTLYLNISTFLPAFRKDHHPSINDGMVGIILSMFQLAYLIAAPFVGAFLGKIGRKTTIVIGYILIILATIGFGLLAYVPDNNDVPFFVLGLIFRFIQGAGDSFVSTAGYSIVTIEFPKRREAYIGYCQAAVGLGLMLGPVLGQLIYTKVEYAATFYIFAGILTCALIVVLFIIPSHLNHVAFDQSKTPSMVESKDGELGNQMAQFIPSEAETRTIEYKIFFRNPRAMIAAISSMFSMIFMLFFDSILSDHL